ncbi:electron carrier/ protein disulfide oxidoreductase [Anaeramoeba flamelloides]|uniref:Electron carrier/ protein disulfide oxidoreductase n=1 Tax=Anaeramoeba flamelloides TaxID=1746091 RepID=A0AAV7ZP79_9EUKA|nr:electron carrier/ protein disulfide oxidoreductase [Anaeramoeba flamelloides]
MSISLFRKNKQNLKTNNPLTGRHTNESLRKELEGLETRIRILYETKNNLLSEEHTKKLQKQLESSTKRLQMKKNEFDLANDQLSQAKDRLEILTTQNTKELESLMGENTLEKLNWLREKIKVYQQKIKEFKLKESSVNLENKLQIEQENLKQIVADNNIIRNEIVDKRETLEQTQKVLQDMIIRKARGLDDEDLIFKEKVQKENDEEISSNEQKLKKLEFELKKLRKLEETRSNLAQQERLYSFRLQLKEKTKENKKLEAELEELKNLMTTPVTEDSETVGLSPLSSEGEFEREESSLKTVVPLEDINKNKQESENVEDKQELKDKENEKQKEDEQETKNTSEKDQDNDQQKEKEKENKNKNEVKENEKEPKEKKQEKDKEKEDEKEKDKTEEEDKDKNEQKKKNTAEKDQENDQQKEKKNKNENEVKENEKKTKEKNEKNKEEEEEKEKEKEKEEKGKQKENEPEKENQKENNEEKQEEKKVGIKVGNEKKNQQQEKEQEQDIQKNENGKEKHESNKINKKKQLSKTNSKQSGIEIDSLQLLLKLPIAVEHFRDFLSNNGNKEYLLIYLDIKKFKGLNLQKERLKFFVTRIFNKYIKPGSLFEISINQQIKENIKNKIEKGEFTTDIYDEIEEIAVKILSENSFEQFKNSNSYFELKKGFQSKIPIDVNLNKPKIVSIVRKERVHKALNNEFQFIPQACPPSQVSEELMEIMISILNANFSISSNQIELTAIKQSIPFHRFVAATTELQNIQFSLLSNHQLQLSFWLNVYNIILLHSAIVNGLPNNRTGLQSMLQESSYIIGGLDFSLLDILNGILRCNKDKKNNTYFNKQDPRSSLCLKIFDPKIHFGVISLTSEVSIIQVYYPKKTSQALEAVTKIQMAKSIKYQKNKFFIPKLFQEYSKDFGENSQKILEWLEKHLDSKKLKYLKSQEKTKIQYLRQHVLLPRFIIDTKTILEKNLKKKKINF